MNLLSLFRRLIASSINLRRSTLIFLATLVGSIRCIDFVVTDADFSPTLLLNVKVICARGFEKVRWTFSSKCQGSTLATFQKD